MLTYPIVYFIAGKSRFSALRKQTYYMKLCPLKLFNVYGGSKASCFNVCNLQFLQPVKNSFPIS